MLDFPNSATQKGKIQPVEEVPKTKSKIKL